MSKVEEKTESAPSWTVRLVSAPIHAYRYFISPLTGSHCRFHPTCSSYSLDALKQHGLLRGGYLSIKRLLKCHPWNAGGIDPVPPRDNVDNQCCDHLTTKNHQHSETST